MTFKIKGKTTEEVLEVWLEIGPTGTLCLLGEGCRLPILEIGKDGKLCFYNTRGEHIEDLVGFYVN